MSGETWRDVAGLEGRYSVSDLGHVRSARSGRALALRRVGKGYLAVLLPRDGGGVRTAYVHRLVLEAFVGPCPPGQLCRHLDGDPANNALANLAWGTPQENSADVDRHGRRALKLTADQVCELRRLRSEDGCTHRDLARRFGVSPALVGFILNGSRRSGTAA